MLFDEEFEDPDSIENEDFDVDAYAGETDSEEDII